MTRILFTLLLCVIIASCFRPNVARNWSLNGLSEYEVEQMYRYPLSAGRMFVRIETGMTYDHVIDLIGLPDKVLNTTESGAYSSETCLWHGAHGGGVIVLFQNGRVVSKTQF